LSEGGVAIVTDEQPPSFGYERIRKRPRRVIRIPGSAPDPLHPCYIMIPLGRQTG
jgi:hypothetical protein